LPYIFIFVVIKNAINSKQSKTIRSMKRTPSLWGRIQWTTGTTQPWPWRWRTHTTSSEWDPRSCGCSFARWMRRCSRVGCQNWDRTHFRCL